MNWLLRQRYRAMLAALVVLIVVYPAVRDHVSTYVLFETFCLVLFGISFVICYRETPFRLTAFLLGIPSILTAAIVLGIHCFTHERPGWLTLVFHLTSAPFMFLTTAAILRAVNRAATVSLDAVDAAFCGYLLVGIAFGHLYCALQAFDPGSFEVTDVVKMDFLDDGRDHFMLTYFSIVTLTTVGFGDIIPASGATRSLAMIEAVTGQFYIAVLVAELIGKRVSQAK